MMDFFCLHATSSTSGKSLRRYVVRTENTQKPSYVFLTTPRQQKESYEEYREARRNLLMLCCEALKGRYPSLDKIVGLGFGFKEDGVNDSS